MPTRAQEQVVPPTLIAVSTSHVHVHYELDITCVDLKCVG